MLSFLKALSSKIEHLFEVTEWESCLIKQSSNLQSQQASIPTWRILEKVTESPTADVWPTLTSHLSP